MSTPNPLTRIEREAEKYVKKLARVHTSDTDGARSCWMTDFKAGYAVAENRAAPVVKALEDRLKEWEAGYQAECAAIDRINKGRRKPSFWAGEDYKMNYPPIPAWVTEAKQLLETYKADQ